MRTAWSLLGLATLLAVACTGNADAECVAAGGVCFQANDPNGCGNNLGMSCDSANGQAYVCCALDSINALDIVDGAVIDDGDLPDVSEAGAADGQTTDAGTHDATKPEAATKNDAAHDGTIG
jgi:hypothetical protein